MPKKRGPIQRFFHKPIKMYQLFIALGVTGLLISGLVFLASALYLEQRKDIVLNSSIESANDNYIYLRDSIAKTDKWLGYIDLYFNEQFNKVSEDISTIKTQIDVLYLQVFGRTPK